MFNFAAWKVFLTKIEHDPGRNIESIEQCTGT